MEHINAINPKLAFEELVRSPYFVDKTGLVAALMPRVRTMSKHVCVTRPRRFGKTVNAKTLACFLTRGLDADPLFEGLDVTRDQAAMAHLGKHDVIYIDFSALPYEGASYEDYIGAIGDGILAELGELWPGAAAGERDLFAALNRTMQAKESGFAFVMDEWDAMFFNDAFSRADQAAFLMFLKQLLKTREYVDFAYMTGIMPIATHSAGSELNMFAEFSFVDDPLYERFFGFTEAEVRELCERHRKLVPGAKVDYEGLASWYDGYLTESGEHMFNPRSVALALDRDRLQSYWTGSKTHDDIYYYVRNDVAGVRDDLVRMVAGEEVDAEVGKFAAGDMSLTTRDEIFSAMVVYGFLTAHDGYVRIPNHELMLKFQDLMAKDELGYVARLAQRSREMLAATLRGDADTMAGIIGAAHDQEVPLLKYGYEEDLAALVNLVYLAARDRYRVRREEHAGRGYADVAFIPLDSRNRRTPPFVVELKAGGSTAEALEQVRSRDYAALFSDGLLDEPLCDARPLAVAIVWDPASKLHECAVEEL